MTDLPASLSNRINSTNDVKRIKRINSLTLNLILTEYHSAND